MRAKSSMVLMVVMEELYLSRMAGRDKGYGAGRSDCGQVKHSRQQRLTGHPGGIVFCPSATGWGCSRR